MNVRLENYSKRTPVRWKQLGDFFLYSIPVVNGAIALMPEVAHGAIIKAWILFGWNMIASLVKIATKYFADDPGEVKAVDKQPQI
jgi:uncharacterized protein (DUF697 family)